MQPLLKCQKKHQGNIYPEDVKLDISKDWTTTHWRYTMSVEINSKLIHSQWRPLYMKKKLQRVSVTLTKPDGRKLLIESLHMKHNSKRAWTLVKKLCEDSTISKEPAKVTINQVAH